MTFTSEQKSELGKPLSREHVKGRKQGGRTVSYIEGWHAIAEANRIFGFDAWSRETVEVKCVSEAPRVIGENKTPGFSVTYIAKVRVTVGRIVREGCGTGHGIDRDAGQAHESAIKEAETDAMKRALMTFGNPFGLALYDKQQANVVEAQDESVGAYVQACETKIAGFTDAVALATWWQSDEQKKMRRDLGLEQHIVDALKNKVMARRDALKPNSEAA